MEVKNLSFCLLFFALCCFSFCSDEGQISGVRGMVVDEAGKGISDISIRFEINNQRGRLIAPPRLIKSSSVISDTDGSFEILEILNNGDYLNFYVSDFMVNFLEEYSSWKVESIRNNQYLEEGEIRENVSIILVK